MLDYKRAVGSGIKKNYNNYQYALSAYRASHKYILALNQLLLLSKINKLENLIRSGTPMWFLRRVGALFRHLFLLSFGYVKFRLMGQGRAVCFFKSTSLTPQALVYVFRFLRRYLLTRLDEDSYRKKLFKYTFNSEFGESLYEICINYVHKARSKFEGDSIFCYVSKTNKYNIRNYQNDYIEEAVYNRYSFVHNVKSKRTLKFLSKIASVFKRIPRNPYSKLLRNFRFPFKVGTKRTSFYLQHRPNRKTISYNDYRCLKLFFGSLRPETFWRNGRRGSSVDAGGWTFLKKYSYLDLRLDYFISRIGFVNNIFDGKRLVGDCKVMVNGRIVKTEGFIVKPYDWIEFISSERVARKMDYLGRLVIQRTQNYNLKALPTFIEVNWALFRFFILPLITLDDFVRPFKTKNYHIGGGKKQPAILA